MQALHVCDRLCICPSCDAPLLYAPAHDKHACSDRNCRYATGAPTQLEFWMERRFVLKED